MSINLKIYPIIIELIIFSYYMRFSLKWFLLKVAVPRILLSFERTILLSFPEKDRLDAIALTPDMMFRVVSGIYNIFLRVKVINPVMDFKYRCHNLEVWEVGIFDKAYSIPTSTLVSLYWIFQKSERGVRY